MHKNELEQKVNHLLEQAVDVDQFCATVIRYIKDSDVRYDWVGIYLNEGGVLRLPSGYYLGTEPDHKEIGFDDGICGAAASKRETVVVDNVHQDPRYLACSLYTQSEIVIPILSEETLIGVLDLDSDTPAAFGEEDQQFLEDAATLIGNYFDQYQEYRTHQ